ncbi:MAG TPA: acetyl-CoA C-acetyltransferase [Rhizomicrobium sp.]|nr:acetyl-CoA C-acetyltransferase [Rhizomicrobium sp.]
MSEAWIIDAARTPRGIGKIGKGGLAAVHPQRILSHVLKALAERNALDTAEIDDVVIGCGTQIGRQGSCIARMAALDAGFANDATGVALDRFCGSGLTAVNIAAMGVMSGAQDLVIAGGVESMSYGFSLPPIAGGFLDSGNEHLRKFHPQPHQGVCGDLIATLEGFTRDDVDRFALESQRRAAHALANGHFDRSLVPVYHDDGALALDREEYPRPNTTLEGLSSLKPAFEAVYRAPLNEEGLTHRKLVEQTYPGIRINHVHHAGNSSGVVDGAGAVVLASPDYARAHGLKPRARIVALATAGDAPEIMLNAPAPAARKALKKAGMTMKDIDLIEVNEAFAAVPLKFIKEMDADPAKLNVNGGAIALGHPIGATGAILLGTLLDELERRDLRTGLVTLCTGGGMAPCTIIERLN